MKIVYLYPNTTFRTDLRSDTLWGIFCWGIRFVYGNEVLEEVLAQYQAGNPPFLISSAFPFIEQNGKKQLFFPRPILPPAKMDTQENESAAKGEQGLKDRKKLKDVAFVSQETLQKIGDGTLTGLALNRHLLSQNESQPFYQSETVTHNYLSRYTNSTIEIDNKGQLFHVEEKYIGIKNLQEADKEAKTGLFFLISGDSSKIDAVLRYLCQVGFGGDTSIGRGSFSYKIADFSFSMGKTPTAMLNLSLYFPQETELATYKNSPFFQYILEERKGKVAGVKGVYDKEMTMMFAEGSIFPYQNSPFIGTNKIVQAKGGNIPHNIYQYGYAFMLPLHLTLNAQ